MDLQKMFTDSCTAARAESFKNSPQLTLGEIILKTEHAIEKASKEENPDYRNPSVYFNFEYLRPSGLSSWRGIYAELALEFSLDGEMKSDEFLKLLKSAIGKTFCGWKGGDFVMGRSTPVWVANRGNSGNTGVVDIVYDGYSIIIETARCES